MSFQTMNEKIEKHIQINVIVDNASKFTASFTSNSRCIYFIIANYINGWCNRSNQCSTCHRRNNKWILISLGIICATK